MQTRKIGRSGLEKHELLDTGTLRRDVCKIVQITEWYYCQKSGGNVI
jgi:hypothetical protein